MDVEWNQSSNPSTVLLDVAFLELGSMVSINASNMVSIMHPLDALEVQGQACLEARGKRILWAAGSRKILTT